MAKGHNRKAERNSEIIRCHYVNGETFSSIAKRLGVNYSRMTEIAKNERERILRLVDEENPIGSVASEYDIPLDKMIEMIGSFRDREEARRAFREEIENAMTCSPEKSGVLS